MGPHSLARHQCLRVLIPACSPALAMCVFYGTLLAYRPDYLGHFAAGYGGSFGLMMLVLAFIPERDFHADSPLFTVVGCLFCIGLGAVFEATVFRMAKFDEVDFCNQSLGAILAALAALAICAERKPSVIAFLSAFVTAMAFLLVGFRYAFS